MAQQQKDEEGLRKAQARIEEVSRELGLEAIFPTSDEGPTPHPLDIGCEEVRKNLPAYKEGTPELSRSLVLQISAHLLQCADCQKVHNT